MLTDVSTGEQLGSLQANSCAEITAASRMAGGINSIDHISMFRKAFLRRSSTIRFSFIAAASGRNMMQFVLFLVFVLCGREGNERVIVASFSNVEFDPIDGFESFLFCS